MTTTKLTGEWVRGFEQLLEGEDVRQKHDLTEKPFLLSRFRLPQGVQVYPKAAQEKGVGVA